MTPKLPDNLREFDDTEKTRKLIYDNALRSVTSRFPIEDDDYRLEVVNPHYEGNQNYTLDQQKQALMKNRYLQTPIKGTWRLVDKHSNAVLDEKDDTIMNVPYYSNRGTIIYNGNEYSVVNQSRLKPGAYVRRQRTGEVESHFNVRPGTGKSFRVHLEPESGIFKLNVGQSNIPLYPLMKTMGVSDRDLAKTWGPELLEANIKKQDKRAIQKMYQRFSGYKYDPNLQEDAQMKYLAESLPKFELDPDVVGRTLGMKDASGVTGPLLLRATQKMLGVSRGEEEPDDRDSTTFSNVLSVEDLIQERIDKDAGNLARSLLYKARRDKALKRLGRGALNPYILGRNGFLLSSRLTQPLEETNPLHTLEQVGRITKLGEGGIGSAESITDEARNVNNSQFGFIDPITGPEGCFTPDMEVMTRTGWSRWEDVDENTEFACNISGRLEYHKPIELYSEEYSGPVYVCETVHFGFSVTKSHRLWLRTNDSKAKYRPEFPGTISQPRRVRCGGHDPYKGSLEHYNIPMSENAGNAYKPLPGYDTVLLGEFIPAWIFEASVEVRQACLTALCKGDGRKKGKTYAYTTTSDRLAKDVELLAFGLGYSVRANWEPDARPQSRKVGAWVVTLHTVQERTFTPKHVRRMQYDGQVHCCTVPGGLVYVRLGDHGGHWSGNLNIGIDTRAAYRTFKGDDQHIYGEFRNPATGKMEYLRPDQVADVPVAFPGEMEKDAPTVSVMYRGKVQRVPKEEVKYEVPSIGHMMSPNTNLNPMPTGVQPGRQFYGSKFWSQYMPQVKGEVPLVDAMAPDGKTTFSEHYGRKIGSLTSKVGGTVSKVKDDAIIITDDNGENHTVDIVKDFPFNRLTGISYFPTVKPGDHVNVGDMVAHSNFTDAKTGALNMGQNLKTAVMPARGMSVAGDTPVFWRRPDGTYTYGVISGVPTGTGMRSLALDADTWDCRELRVHSWMIHAPDSPMLRVCTCDGMEVRATESHSFVGFFGDAVRECTAGELLESGALVPVVQPVVPFDSGDHVVICTSKAGVAASREFALDREFGWVVGMYLAEGCCVYRKDYAHHISWAVTEPELIARMEQFFAVRGIHTRTDIRKTDDGLTGAVTVCSAAVAQWFADNCGRYAWFKRLPDCLWTAPVEFAEGVIDGYFCGDGTVSDKQCTATTTSRLLADGLAFLLAALGVRATYREYPNGKLARRPAYLLHVFQEFLQGLPTISLKRKHAAIERLRARKVKFSRDRIPIPGSELPIIRKLFKHRLPKDQYVSRSLLQRHYLELPPRIKALVDAPVWWDYVKQVEPCASEEYVYDLDMRPLGNFVIGGGWVLHNSYEDAYMISESAAKRLATQRLYGFDTEVRNGVRVDKNKYISAFPREFTKEQIENIDDTGVVKPGTVLQPGDPIILATGPKLLTSADAQLGKLHKVLRNAQTNRATVWEHDHPGTVTDAAVTSSGVKVNVKSEPTVHIGDKLCYDPVTEVLTRRGWLPIADVTLSDEVATLDPDTGVFEYMHPASVQQYRHDGRMYRLKNSALDLLVTDNHQLYIKRRGREQYELLPADKIKGKRVRHKKDGVWRGASVDKVYLPACDSGHRWGSITRPALELPAEAYTAVLGAYLSEGNIVWHEPTSTYGIDICQVKGAGLQTLAAVLDKHGVGYCLGSNGTKLRIHGKQWALYFRQFGKSWEKYIPNEVFEWSVELQRELLKWLMWSDGYSEGQRYVCYTTCSRRLADDVQRLCLHVGYAGRVVLNRTQLGQVSTIVENGVAREIAVVHPCHDVRIITHKLRPEVNHAHAAGQRSQVEEWVDYHGNVHCVSMPRHHVIYVRRNGHAVWCGNSTRYGLKGVVGKIVPDEEMPKDPATGTPYELLMNPMGILSRVAPAQLIELQLAKVAKLTGEQVRLPQNPPPEGWAAWAEKKLAEAGISESHDVIDPVTGKTIKDVADGYVYASAFHHLADKKLSHRGEQGSYTMDEQPAKGGTEGAKRFCFVGKQPLEVLGGEETIGHIVENRQRLMVKTFDMGAWTYAPVVDWFVRSCPVSDILTISVEYIPTTRKDRQAVVHTDRTMWVTREHDLYTPELQTVKAGDVRPGMWLAGEGYVFTDIQKSLLYGSMLGDGAICDNAYNEQHALAQSAYLAWKQQVLSGICSNRTRTTGKTSGYKPGRVAYMTIHRPDVVEYLRTTFIRDGVKRVPQVIDLSDMALSVWVLDDGHIGNKSKKAGRLSLQGNIATHGFMRDDVVRLSQALNAKFGGNTSVNSTNAIYLDAITCEALAQVIARTVPAAVIPASKRWLVKRVTELQTGIELNPVLPQYGIVPVRVRSVEPYKHDKPGVTSVQVYDITVPGAHKYKTAGVLVSNSMMDVNATLAHGATAVVKDAMTIRGTRNEDFWKALRMGRPLPEPKVPFIYDKFLNTLKAGGINIVDKGDVLSLMPMTDDDVTQLSKGGIKSSKQLDGDFNPIPGGLFDMGKTGGAQGNRWTHVDLAEPIPNPVMEEPIRRILGLRQKDLRDIIGGGEVEGIAGTAGLKKKLEELDIDAEIAYHLERVQKLRGANRDSSVKALGYLTSAKEQGIHPSKWMINKVPIMPPMFRPIARMGDTPLVADMNELYQNLIDQNNNIADLRGELPDSELAEEKLTLYDSVAAAYGLGDPITPEGQSKKLKGAIRQVIGNNPKGGMFQSKVVSKTVGGVGRGVVTPDPNLDMDSIGLPEDSAWKIYQDFVMRKLVRKGYPPTRALEMIQRRDPGAKTILEEEMASRPVLVNRAPVWHKFNLLAFTPHIDEGNTIRVSPLITKGFTMDFDGDQANFHVPVSDKAVEQAKEKMMPSKNLFSLTDLRSIRHAPTMEMTLGLYQLTREMSDKPPVRFATVKDAQRAYREGKIGLNDPIEIG